MLITNIRGGKSTLEEMKMMTENKKEEMCGRKPLKLTQIRTLKGEKVGEKGRLLALLN